MHDRDEAPVAGIGDVAEFQSGLGTAVSSASGAGSTADGLVEHDHGRVTERGSESVAPVGFSAPAPAATVKKAEAAGGGVPLVIGAADRGQEVDIAEREGPSGSGVSRCNGPQ